MIISVITISLLEVVMAVSFAFPTLSPLPIDTLKHIHIRELRPIIQVLSECAQYDPEVSYTLRPGTCEFESYEFDTKVNINSVGLRDDEQSLVHPEIIVLGDSHAMGWGVQQDQSFPSVIEHLSGKKTLNAAISSYGTAREVYMLKRLDVSHLRYLVIQYADNDINENRTLFEQGSLNITPQAYREEVIEKHRRTRKYFPGKYALITAWYISKSIVGDHALDGTDITNENGIDKPADLNDEVEYFLNALLQAGSTIPADTQLIVLEVNDYKANDILFIHKLENRVRMDEAFPQWVRQAEFLNIKDLLSSSDYYPLDDHMKAAGHEKIGQAIAKMIRH